MQPFEWSTSNYLVKQGCTGYREMIEALRENVEMLEALSGAIPCSMNNYFKICTKDRIEENDLNDLYRPQEHLPTFSADRF